MNDKELFFGKRLADLGLVTGVPGRSQFWSMVKDRMVARGDSALLLKREMDSSVGGMLSSDMYDAGYWFVVSRLSCLTDKGLRFRTEKQMAIFFHELGHYIHLALNSGKFTEVPCTIQEPELRDSSLGRFAVELEAWGVSRRMDRLFRMGLQEHIDRANAFNMSAMSVGIGLYPAKGRSKRAKWSYSDWLAEASRRLGT